MSFTCPACWRTSHNPSDELHSYCGNCHLFLTDLGLSTLSVEDFEALLSNPGPRTGDDSPSE